MASLSDAFKSVEGFENAGLPVSMHQDLIKSSQEKYNKYNDVIPRNKLKSREMKGLFGGPAVANPSINEVNPAMQIKGAKKVADLAEINQLKQHAERCEKFSNIDCSPFDNPGFEGCGLCMKIGTNHEGNSHMGGLYIGAYDTPVLGSCDAEYFATSKEECAKIKRKMECETNQKFGNGCSQCLDDGKFYLIDPTAVEPASIFLTSNGIISVQVGGKEIANIKSNTSFQEVELDGVKERDAVEIIVKSTDSSPPWLMGYITGPTLNGKYIMDLAKIMLVDTQTGTRPRIRGSNEVDGNPIMVIGAGQGKNFMQLPFNVPFTFLSKSDPSAGYCAVSPVVLSEESAKEMNSSPCYSKSSAPGSYSKECLDQIYTNSGCSPAGSLDPSKDSTALLYDGSKPRTMTDIIQYLNTKFVEASTGKAANGAKLSIEDWNNSSLMCLGKEIKSPCDVPGPNGKLSDQCIQYLYENGGAGKEVGGTYTLTNRASLVDGKDAYCTRAGTAAPYKAAAIEAARAKGGIDEVKKYFDDLHRGMYSTNISNAERSKYTEACIGFNSDVRDDLPAPIGIQARYVRFLRNPGPRKHIQISKLEVIDRTGRDVALKRPTEAKSEHSSSLNKDKPVNGAEWFYWNMYHDKNESSDAASIAAEYWLVDLGEMKDICLINYYNRVDCCQERSKGTRMQLLDANKNLVREEVLGYGYIQSFSYVRDSNPEIMKKVLLGYDNAISLVQYDRVRGKKLYLSYMQQYTGYSRNENDQTYNNISTINMSVVPASFRLRHAEKGRAVDLVSLSPIGKPNTIIRHANYVISADIPRAMELFRNDSTFKVLPGSKPGYIRLQSVNYPSLYIGTRKTSDGKVNQDVIYIMKAGDGDIEWAVETPFQKNTAGPEVYLSAYRRYDFDFNTAQERCMSEGGRLATKAELAQAQQKGAQWCNFGHIAGGGAHTFPMQVANPSCGNKVGVFEIGRPNSARADVNCYGPKPSPDFVAAAPFVNNVAGSPSKKQVWSSYDM